MGTWKSQPSSEDKDGRGSGPEHGNLQTYWRWQIATGKEVDELKPVSHLFISALLHPMINAASTLSATSLTTETCASKTQANTCEEETSH